MKQDRRSFEDMINWQSLLIRSEHGGVREQDRAGMDVRDAGWEVGGLRRSRALDRKVERRRGLASVEMPFQLPASAGCGKHTRMAAWLKKPRLPLIARGWRNLVVIANEQNFACF